MMIGIYWFPILFIICQFCITQAATPAAATCEEKFVDLQLAHSRLQVEHFKLRQQISNCPGIKRNPSDIIIIKESIFPKNTNTATSLNNGKLPSTCADVTTKVNGVYELKEVIPGQGPLRVACEFNLYNGDWTLIQRRANGTVNFNRSWKEYKKGFGDPANEYWLGLDNIHHLTKQQQFELVFIMEDFDNQKKYANYAGFAIGDESDKYALTTLGKYTGDAGDSFKGHIATKFSTVDQDNDNWEEGACATTYKGGWWFNRCLTSNLNGPNLIGEFDKSQCCRGLHWLNFRGEYYSLKSSAMMIRPIK